MVADAVEGLHAQVERLEGDVGAVDGVVVSAGQIGGEGIFGGVAGGTVPAVVRERDRLDEGQAQVGGPGDAGRDLSDLDGMGQPGAQVIVFGGDENLTFAGESPPRTRVLDAVEVAFETEAERVGFLGATACAGPGRPGRAGRQASCEVGFAFLAAQQPPADDGEGIAMRVTHGRLDLRDAERLPSDETDAQVGWRVFRHTTQSSDLL